ncbi:MAG TPA: CDGSH iron-sulfur domain-containing protein [Crinalium sp.]
MVQDSFILQLEAGTHWICSCGQSKNSPYCDGSHKGTTFQPLALELAALSTVEISGSVNTKV